MNKCQHCHKEITGVAKLPERCPHCDQGTVCSGDECMYCKTLQKWVAACKPDAEQSPLTQLNEYTREAYCPECDERTTQLLHGYEADGSLWKENGACKCGSFQCSECDLLLDQSKACSR